MQNIIKTYSKIYSHFDSRERKRLIKKLQTSLWKGDSWSILCFYYSLYYIQSYNNFFENKLKEISPQIGSSRSIYDKSFAFVFLYGAIDFSVLVHASAMQLWCGSLVAGLVDHLLSFFDDFRSRIAPSWLQLIASDLHHALGVKGTWGPGDR